MARYADSFNHSVNAGQRYARSYTYRDWVIRALNEDLPYDRFVLYQLAADRVPDPDARHLAALGFLSLGREFPNSYAETVDDRIDVVTRGLLGLTVSCARCHDHKYDPIPTKDYYSLYSILSNGFIVLCPDGLPTQGNQNWRSAFLPAAYQATHIDTRETQIDKLIENIRNRFTSPAEQRRQLDLLAELNRGYQERRQNEALLEARVQSFELAFRMQMEADDAFDPSREPEHIHKLYGEGLQARQMMIVRKLLERGVRLVQVCMALASHGRVMTISGGITGGWRESATSRSRR